MNLSYDDALLLYLSHCNAHRQFFSHPLRELSELIGGDWHLRNKNGLIAIINNQGEIEYTQDAALQLIR
jgi:hypothetical protein